MSLYDGRQIKKCIAHLKLNFVVQNGCCRYCNPDSLLTIFTLLALDLSSNNIVTLPEDIKQLSNLEELYLQNNDIQKISESICSLQNLKVTCEAS